MSPHTDLPEALPSVADAELRLAELQGAREKAAATMAKASKAAPTDAELAEARRILEAARTQQAHTDAATELRQAARAAESALGVERAARAELTRAIAASPLGRLIAARRDRVAAAEAFGRALQARVKNVSRLHLGEDPAIRAALDAELAGLEDANAVRATLPENHPAHLRSEPTAAGAFDPIIDALVALVAPSHSFAVGQVERPEDVGLRMRVGVGGRPIGA